MDTIETLCEILASLFVLAVGAFYGVEAFTCLAHGEYVPAFFLAIPGFLALTLHIWLAFEYAGLYGRDRADRILDRM